MALRRFPGLNHRQRALLDHAVRHPSQVYTFQAHQNSHAITYVTARSDLLDLSKRGLLSETKAGKQRAFVAAEDLVEQLSLAPEKRKRRKE